ncbi:hypothetical protein BD779DRAFT_1669497 [Infundibulicybe gibba]|nr:hypothetical protein BD779DRAFT_1669497 [Infundibulicybe gibba]
MRQPYASSSSASSSSTHVAKKRRWTREQLLRNLEILGNIPPPLPPTLPPSPPASRASSPTPSYKRKSDSQSDRDHSKRPRTNSFSRPFHHQQHQPPPPTQHLRMPTSAPAFNPRNEPCEDGEVREEPVASSSSLLPPPEVAIASSSRVPIRRPKRGKPTLRHYDSLHDKYHNAGRMLKYSGDARFWSTYPASHKEYRPLADPPPVGSPYHIHGGLIARLELLDALVCFTYSIWNKDYSRRICNKDTWSTVDAFLIWCKQKWQTEDGINESEKAFLGLIWMIEAFIHGRKLAFSSRIQLDSDMDKLLGSARTAVAAAVAQAEENPAAGVTAGLLKSHATPPMLPSPASIAPANSANSTPTTRDGSTPNTSNGRSTTASAATTRAIPPVPGQPPIPPNLLSDHLRGTPMSPHVHATITNTTIPVTVLQISAIKDHTSGTNNASWCMNTAQASLTLPIMARYFPTTFSRIIKSSLSFNEEHEPDFEDEEGELFWPTQSITGEGLGWLCLMGKAMIKEFGKAYGYRGLDGVVPKPKHEEVEDGGASTTQGRAFQRPGATPQPHNSTISAHR